MKKLKKILEVGVGGPLRMDRKHGKYTVNTESSGSQLVCTCPKAQEAQSSTDWCPPPSDVSSHLPGVWMSPAIHAHTGCPYPEPPHPQVHESCCSDWSLCKVFLACLLACMVTTAIGVLTLSLVNNKATNASIIIQLLPNGQPTVTPSAVTSALAQTTDFTTTAVHTATTPTTVASAPPQTTAPTTTTSTQLPNASASTESPPSATSTTITLTNMPSTPPQTTTATTTTSTIATPTATSTESTTSATTPVTTSTSTNIPSTQLQTAGATTTTSSPSTSSATSKTSVQ